MQILLRWFVFKRYEVQFDCAQPTAESSQRGGDDETLETFRHPYLQTELNAPLYNTLVNDGMLIALRNLYDWTTNKKAKAVLLELWRNKYRTLQFYELTHYIEKLQEAKNVHERRTFRKKIRELMVGREVGVDSQHS